MFTFAGADVPTTNFLSRQLIDMKLLPLGEFFKIDMASGTSVHDGVSGDWIAFKSDLPLSTRHLIVIFGAYFVGNERWCVDHGLTMVMRDVENVPNRWQSTALHTDDGAAINVYVVSCSSSVQLTLILKWAMRFCQISITAAGVQDESLFYGTFFWYKCMYSISGTGRREITMANLRDPDLVRRLWMSGGSPDGEITCTIF